MTDLDPLQRLSTEGMRCRQQRHGDNKHSRPKPDAAVKLMSLLALALGLLIPILSIATIQLVLRD